MPLIMYPFTALTGKVAGTLAMPTVTPLFESSDQKVGSFSIALDAVTPPTRKPVMPFSSEGALVAKMEYTFGQLGAETVRSLPETPCCMTRAKFGISPRTSNGLRMSHSAPFTPRRMTRGFDTSTLGVWPKSGKFEQEKKARSR